MTENDSSSVGIIKVSTGLDYSADWERQGQAWDAFVDEMWGAYRHNLPPSSIGGGSITPVRYWLNQNYPNPFNPETTIEYHLPGQTRVTIKVFDLLGREVSTLVDGVKGPGYESVKFDAHGLASGLYFYRLQADDFTETRKLLYLR